MSIFRRDSEPKTDIEKQEEEIFEFPFHVLWLDEEPSSFLQYIPQVIMIILLIWILVKTH